MKKIIYLICSVFISFSAYATEMCAHRDVTVIPLDATVSPLTGNNTQQSSAVEWVWMQKFDYGWVTGVATCLSLQEVRDISGDSTISRPSANYTLPTDDYELMGRSEYYNGDTSDVVLYGRSWCFCKLTHPMSSQWVNAVMDSASVAFCKSKCPGYCLIWQSMPNLEYRTALFRSIGK